MIEDGGGFMSAYIEFQNVKKIYQMGEVQKMCIRDSAHTGLDCIAIQYIKK